MVTADVLSRISAVDGLIVIFSITDAEHQEYIQVSDKNKYSPNLHWLLFELGIGMGKKIPIVQIRDITVVSNEQWNHWVNISKDSSLCFIDRKKPEQMKEYLEDAVKAILYKISSEPYLK